MAATYGDPEILGIPWQTQLRTTAPGSTDREDACLGMAVLGPRPGWAAEPRLGISTLLMHAASSGSVRLSSADADVQPEIDLNYLAEPGDRQVLLGSNEPLPVDQDAWRVRLFDPAVQAYLGKEGAGNVQWLLDLLRPLHRTGRRHSAKDLNRDLFPRDEFLAER